MKAFWFYFDFIHNNAHKFFILSLDFLKLLILSVAFFLGHPVYPMTRSNNEGYDCFFGLG